MANHKQPIEALLISLPQFPFNHHPPTSSPRLSPSPCPRVFSRSPPPFPFTHALTSKTTPQPLDKLMGFRNLQRDRRRCKYPNSHGSGQT